jgi:hypothetical protein
MLQNIKELYGHKLAASDGEIGQVQDFYFNDNSWVVRYLVADTGNWLSGRQVLLSPHAFGFLDREQKILEINLTRKQIEDSPSIETHKPVSRQYEIDYYRYYGWPAYWNGGAMWGLGGYPVLMPPSVDMTEEDARHTHRVDKHLQSTRSLEGYGIQALDGPLGHVRDLRVDDRNWAIRYLVAQTGHWYAGHEVPIASALIDRISFVDSTVFVNATMSEVQATAEQALVRTGAGDYGTAAFSD